MATPEMEPSELLEIFHKHNLGEIAVVEDPNTNKLIGLIEQRDRNTAILMISEDLDEVFGVSDRVAVMYEGEVMGIVDPKTATREEVGLMMAGVSQEEAKA